MWVLCRIRWGLWLFYAHRSPPVIPLFCSFPTVSALSVKPWGQAGGGWPVCQEYPRLMTPEGCNNGHFCHFLPKPGPIQGVEKRNRQKSRFRLTPEESDDSCFTVEKRLPIYIGIGIKQCKSALFQEVLRTVTLLKTPDLSRLICHFLPEIPVFQKGPTRSIVLIKRGSLFA